MDRRRPSGPPPTRDLPPIPDVSPYRPVSGQDQNRTSGVMTSMRPRPPPNMMRGPPLPSSPSPRRISALQYASTPVRIPQSPGQSRIPQPSTPIRVTGPSTPTRVPGHSTPTRNVSSSMSSSRSREPGYFDAQLPSSPEISPMEENIRTIRRVPTFERGEPISPLRLEDPLRPTGLSSRQQTLTHSGTQSSYTSHGTVSSITPSEAEMMRDSWDGRGNRLDPAETEEQEPRFSHVPSLFNVAGVIVPGVPSPLREATSSRSITHQRSLGPASRSESGSTDPFFDNSGSQVPSSRPDMPPPSSTLENVSPAPIFSLTAAATLGIEVIAGNRTYEQSSVGSVETAPRKRHYEGCMLCSPLPSPSSSVTSVVLREDPVQAGVQPIVKATGRFRSNSTSGPPPTAPLPDMVKQQNLQTSRTHRQSTQRNQRPVSPPPPESNKLTPYLQGEVVPVIKANKMLDNLSGFRQAESSRGPSEDQPSFEYTPPSYPQHQQRGSLSTLNEVDEDQARHPRLSISRVPKPEQPLQQISRPPTRGTENSRPTTTESNIINLARIPTTTNQSQSSLIDGRSPQPGNSTNSPGYDWRERHRNIVRRLTSVSEVATNSRPVSWVKDTARRLKGTSTVNEAPAIEMRPIRSIPKKRTDGATMFPFTNDGMVDVSLSEPPGTGNKEMITVKKRAAQGWLKWTICITALILVIVTITVPTVLVAIPRRAQQAVNKAKVTLNSLTIGGATQETVKLNFDMGLMGIKGLENLTEYGVPMTIKLVGTDYSIPTTPSMRMIKSSKVAGVPKDGFKALKYVDPFVPHGAQKHRLVNSPELADDVRVVRRQVADQSIFERVQLVNLDASLSEYEIKDPEAWGRTMEVIVATKDGVTAKIEGTVPLKWAGVNTVCKVSKEIKLPGIGGLGMVVTDYDALSNNDTFLVKFILRSDSITQIDFGKIRFDILFGLTPIGNATVDKFSVQQGNHTFIAYGTLSESVMRKDPDLVGRFVSALFLKSDSNPTTALSLRGASIIPEPGNEGPKWLNPAVQRLAIRLPALNRGPEQNIVKSFDMDLKINLNGDLWNTQAKISTDLNQFFASEGLGSNIKSLGYHVFLAKGEETPYADMSFPTHIATIEDGNAHVIYPARGLTVTNPIKWVEDFLKPLVQNKNVSIGISGNATAVMDTSVGTAKVTDIDIKTAPITLPGFNLADKESPPGLNVIIYNLIEQQAKGLHIQIAFQLPVSEKIELNLGNVTLRVSYMTEGQNIITPLGTMFIPDFHLGTNRTALGLASLNLEPAHQFTYNTFLTDYFRGGNFSLSIDAPNASTNKDVATALNGIAIPLMIKSPGYIDKFLKRIDITYFPSRDKDQMLEATVEWANPLTISISLFGFELYLEQGAQSSLENFGSVGKFEKLEIMGVTMKPGENGIFKTGYTVANTGGLNQAQMEEWIKRERQVRVTGRVAVGMGLQAPGIVMLEHNLEVKVVVG
ncbi:hypothetical protein BZA77DRAFT_371857 [Pyronema omphalodes]|nr:hypothetical protein BZA77DRAFT_371857 [Pyronema omphalodes]